MVREQFIRLKNDIVIFDPVEDKMVTVKSSFVNPKKVKDDDILLCSDFFIHGKEVKIPVAEHGNWVQFKVDSFMDDLSQGLINKLLLKRIMVLENKLAKTSSILK